MKKLFSKLSTVCLLCMLVASTALTVSAESVTTRSATGLPIHMVPSENVPILWTTNRTDSGYASFVPGNINTGTTLTIKGSFRHSLSSGTCRSGVGIFSGGQFFSKGATTRKAGYPFNNTNGTNAGLVAISKLSADLTHYGFIQNYSNSGAITSADITIVAE